MLMIFRKCKGCFGTTNNGIDFGDDFRHLVPEPEIILPRDAILRCLSVRQSISRQGFQFFDTKYLDKIPMGALTPNAGTICTSDTKDCDSYIGKGTP